MIERAIILSLQITAIYILFQQGMLLGWFRIAVATRFDKWFGFVVSRDVQKFLWDCLPCMSAFWTIQLTHSIDLSLIFIVCGINVIIDKIIE